MTKKFDKAKIEAALKQAASTAINGTRDERSGRFLASQVAARRPDRKAKAKQT